MAGVIAFNFERKWQHILRKNLQKFLGETQQLPHTDSAPVVLLPARGMMCL